MEKEVGEERGGKENEGKREEAKKDKDNVFVKWFSELSNKDIQVAGGKGASLAEMYNAKFPIPPGFIVTAQAYSYFLEKSILSDKIDRILRNIDIEKTEELEEKAREIRDLIVKAKMPKELEEEILEAYDILDVDKPKLDEVRRGAVEILKMSHEPVFVAVRSSATTEDLADASFAGQQDTFLNVKGEKQVIEKVKECFASLFTARAVYYRTKKGFAHNKAQLAVVVQRMIDSEKSGVIFSKNPMSNKDEIVIEAVFGLGEGIVSGKIKPDHFVVSGDIGNFEIKDIQIGEKKIAIVRDSSGETKSVKLSDDKREQQVLDSYEIKILAQYAKRLEDHYKKPQDIEFAIARREIYIVQSRPITTTFSEKERREIEGNLLLSGLGASGGISYGTVKVIRHIDELNKIKKGDVLVTEMTNPDMVVSMQKAAAIVTDEGGLTSHAAIISREMGIPAVVGTGEATRKLYDGQIVTVDGFNGKVYEGKGEEKKIEIKPIVPTKTKIKVIVDIPDFAERAAMSGAKEVGLVRLEGIIASGGRHPLYFVDKKRIEEYTAMLYYGLRKIAQNFEGMWIRTSDIRSDEFGDLEGSPHLKEDNPMLGDHGVRFSLRHGDIMEAELEAVLALIKEFPHKKFGIMLPQVISVQEFKETKEMAVKLGMEGKVDLGVMVETPAAVQIINELCEEGINFISFGTNDLTQYMLAIDRNNTSVQELFNEMHPAVLSAISYVIRKCKKYRVETSICGQAGSKEEMARFLVQEGIDSISVNADAAEKVSKVVANIEGKGYDLSIMREKNERKVVEEIGGTPVLSLSLKKDRDMKNEYDDKIVEGKDKNYVEKAGKDIPKLPELHGMMQNLENSLIKNNLSNKDIEEIVLEQLNDDYQPGLSETDVDKRKRDIPPLYEAVTIDSDLFNRLERSEGVDV